MKSPGSAATADILTKSLIAEPHTASERLMSRIYGHMDQNREALGLPPAGSTGGSWPYFICSNDVCSKFTGFMELCLEKRGTIDDYTIIFSMLDDLIASYDEHGMLWHSSPKETFVRLRETMLTIQSSGNENDA